MTTPTCLITASTGIGAETAKILASRGTHVFVMSRTESNLHTLAQEIRNAGGQCDYAVADVTRGDMVEAAVEQCLNITGRIDALFNVAGISGSKYCDGPIHACTESGWDKVMSINVKGMFLVCRAVLKQMLEQEPDSYGIRGSILNMSSVLGISPMPAHFVTHGYAASKGAIISMSRSMAGYYARHKIRVNVIAPGLTETPMAGRAVQNETICDAMKNKQPLTEGVMDTSSVAESAAFLLSHESRAITGDVLIVDGGWCVMG
ncbi:MAG: SDR family oxidoreductase [Gammaproteobacteria bacterium]|nr:MAG: SDR family oxidoreductase [Gammaproteobacteria bacterium]